MKFRDIKQYTRCSSYNVSQPIKTVGKWIEEHQEYFGDNFKMDPAFQRVHVWTEKQQIRYVEFLLKGGMTGRDIYWNCHGFIGGTNKYPLVLVDGKQRLEAIRRFFDNEIPIFGCLYKDYEDKLDSMNFLNFHVNDLKTDEEIMQWYIDLNAGGTVHTDEEIEKVEKMLEDIRSK